MSSVSSSSSSSFKCNSCSIQFPNSDSQRYHMKTDWHRYNLKRRVAQLAPVDATVFAEKVAQLQQFEQERDEFGFLIEKPRATKKHHVKSGGHRRDYRGRSVIENNLEDIERSTSPASTVASEISHFSLGESVYSASGIMTDTDSNYGETASETDTYPSYKSDSDDEDDNNDDLEYGSDYEEEPIQPVTSCIYCGAAHRDIESNVSHMFKKHGLYIPERSYLVDLKGLLEFLIDVIVVNNECLCCSFKGKALESIRAHLKSKGHCRLPYETAEERAVFDDFYDFSSLNAKSEKSKSKKNVGFAEVEDEEQNDNGNYRLVCPDPIDSALSLPNGSRLGHRKYNRIYRQNLPLPRQPTESQLTISTIDQRLSNGLALREYYKTERKVQLLEQREKSHNIRREVSRINFQPHFRDQMLGG